VSKKEAPEIHYLECKCGAAVSGPDRDSVEETMARHKAKCKAKESKHDDDAG
jgi:hypothetical protein